MEVIYKLTSPSKRVYIGRAKDFNDRMAQHKYEATVLRKDYPLYRAIRKYGWENFKKEVIDTAPKHYIVELEKHYIIEHNAIKMGYNATISSTAGGDKWERRKDTQQFQDFKDKMKIINSGENNGMYGRKHSEETKKLLKEKAAGRCSLEWFINKHGEVEGTRRYESMMEKRRKNRYAKMKTDAQGKFI